MKNFLLVFLFPFIALGQSPNSAVEDENRYKESQRKVVEKIFYPNPTYGTIEFNLDLIGHDNIMISVNNILAKELWSESVSRANRKVNLSFLMKGTYLLSIKKMDGEVLTTRRLVIITP